jgi:hypothetical protein
VLRAIEVSDIVVNQPLGARDYIGSHKDEVYYFEGFMYAFYYYEFARTYEGSCPECPLETQTNGL